MVRNEFSRSVVVDPWPEAGITVDLRADAEERAALTRRFGLVEIRSLAGRGHIERAEDTGELRLRGRLEAEVVQTCVVSLEPVAATVREAIERRYRVGSGPAALEQEVVVDPDAIDVELLEGSSLDLGEVLAEELGLALEPYPHAEEAYALLPELGPGVSLGEVEDDEAPSPFAALRELKLQRAQ